LYPSLKDVRASAQATEGPWWRPRVTANVVYLGMTSLLTDVSSEMVNSVVPLFLTFQLGFSRFQLGLFNGVYQVLAALTALLGGALADRYRRYKEVAGIGYGVSAATRIGLVAAQSAWVPATGMLYADRAAKGLRTAPRDALISQSALPRRLGEAFGVHRAMDTAGALAGPLLAFALLTAVPGGYDEIFRASFWIALSGLAVLVLLVRNRPASSQAIPRRSISVRGSFGLLRVPEYRRLVIAASALSMVTIADALVYVAFQQQTSMTTRFFPLLYVGTALAYLVFALPMGRLADRIGPTRVFVGGQALLLIVDTMLLFANVGALSLIVLLAALGTYYAATDGILAVVATSILPDQQRASGLALLDGAMALAAFAASTIFGAIWEWKGATFSVVVFLVGLIFSLVTALALLGPQLRRERFR
jgi:MFS family permease